jgi:hypothetical protein
MTSLDHNIGHYVAGHSGLSESIHRFPTPMKFTILGLEISARKAPAKRRPRPVDPQPAAAKFKDPLIASFGGISSDRLTPASDRPLQLPGKTSPWYQPQPLAHVTRIY